MQTSEEIIQHGALCQKRREELKAQKVKGPWLKEPDRLQWKHDGMDCMIIRHPSLFHLCGYVGVKPGHPYFGKGYEEIDDLPAHGGLTHSAACRGHICHITDDPEDNTWWFGFDCAHAFDLIPGMLSLGKEFKELQKLSGLDRTQYHTVPMVKANCEEMAEVLSRMKA